MSTFWARVVALLQGNYSRILYGREHFVDASALTLIWLPLVSDEALDLLACMGVCSWAPDKTKMLPLYAPGSTVAPGASVWRVAAPSSSTAVPSHSWIEVAHRARLPPPNEAAYHSNPWFYVAPGSGVSLNVGRTAAIRIDGGRHACSRPDPEHEPQAIEAYGLNLSLLDSLQLLEACDPGDSKEWKPRGFRHEIMLLSSRLLSESSSLAQVVDRTAPTIASALLPNALLANGSTAKSHTGAPSWAPSWAPSRWADYKGAPALLCGRVPHLFTCASDSLPLHFMERDSLEICGDSRWSRILRRCSNHSNHYHRHSQLGCTFPRGRPPTCPLHSIEGGAQSGVQSGASVAWSFDTDSNLTTAARARNDVPELSTRPCADCSVLMAALAVDASSRKHALEAAGAARMLKLTMRPALPLILAANSCFRELLKAEAALWDQHRPLRLLEELRPYAPGGDGYEAPILSKGCSENVSERFRGVSLRGGVLRGDHPLKRLAFVLKLCALLSSETSRTLYLDLDVFVLSADLAMELLTSALLLADVAMPGPVPERHQLVEPALTVASRSVPVLCSCLMAYRSTPAVLAWFRDAARSTLRTERPDLSRQSDQEYLWLQRAENATHAKLRVLGLPDEYYCPAPERVFVDMDPARGASPVLRAHTRIGGQTYECRSVHGHQVTPELIAKVADGVRPLSAAQVTTKQQLSAPHRSDHHHHDHHHQHQDNLAVHVHGRWIMKGK